MRELRLLIACGGTGGHIFPAVALADSLKEKYPKAQILFAGTFNIHMQEMLKSRGYEVRAMAGRGMPYRLNILILPFLIKSVLLLFSAFYILLKRHPAAVVSMGSFSGAPFVLAGKTLGIPVIIHEQNLMPGRANRISAYFADKIATSFTQTSAFFPKRMRQKIVCTGNPLRKELLKALKKNKDFSMFGLDDKKFTILVTGGSQGAAGINRVFIETAKRLDRERFQILHLTGKIDFESSKSEYEKIGIKNRVFSFLDDMAAAYGVSDLVICRSGAMTLAEITALGLASVLVPYPWGDGHQAENAKVLKAAGAAFVVHQKYLTPDTLSGIIKDISENKSKLEDMKDNSRKLAMPDAAGRLAEEVAGLVEQNEIS